MKLANFKCKMRLITVETEVGRRVALTTCASTEGATERGAHTAYSSLMRLERSHSEMLGTIQAHDKQRKKGTGDMLETASLGKGKGRTKRDQHAQNVAVRNNLATTNLKGWTRQEGVRGRRVEA
eukprot:4538602-Pleurochrysis_carterae.AAC.1